MNTATCYRTHRDDVMHEKSIKIDCVEIPKCKIRIARPFRHSLYRSGVSFGNTYELILFAHSFIYTMESKPLNILLAINGACLVYREHNS